MLLRSLLLLVCVLVANRSVHGQEQAEASEMPIPVQTISASNPKSDTPKSGTADSLPAEKGDAQKTDDEVEPVVKHFELPMQHHAWARFQPGAWREMQTITTVVDESGNPATQNLTIQRETLEAVAEGKYVLKVQATIEVGGKQIVGEEKTRVLHLATDGAGPLSETLRMDDGILPLNGRELACQVWELRYQDDARSLREVVHYSDSLFPYVLQRQVFVDEGPGEAAEEAAEESQPDGELAASSAAERRIELVALDVPCLHEEQLLRCTCLRSYRHREKGDSVRVAFVSPEMPGGEVMVSTSELDAEGQLVRSSVTRLVGFGGTLIPSETAAAELAQP